MAADACLALFGFWRPLLFRPTLVGEELYTQMGFFVPMIFACQYIHRRELTLEFDF